MKSHISIQSVVQGVLTAAVIAVALPFPAAWAESDLSTSVTSLQSGIAHVPQIVAGIFYIGGAALTGAGLLKLKAHAENPTSEPLGKAMGRLVAGMGLLALPAVGSWLNNSVGLGNTATTESTFGTLQ